MVIISPGQEKWGIIAGLLIIGVGIVVSLFAVQDSALEETTTGGYVAGIARVCQAADSRGRRTRHPDRRGRLRG